MAAEEPSCDLCSQEQLAIENALAYVRYDNHSLSRGHVHVHLIPRYAGDVPDPRGGIRCVPAGSRPAV